MKKNSIFSFLVSIFFLVNISSLSFGQIDSKESDSQSKENQKESPEVKKAGEESEIPAKKLKDRKVKNPDKEAKKPKVSKPLNLLKFSLGVGVSKITKAPVGRYDSNGLSHIAVMYNLGKSFMKKLHPFIIYRYSPYDVVIKNTNRTFRGVLESHNTGIHTLYSFKNNHYLVTGLEVGLIVPQIKPSDLLAEKPPKVIRESKVSVSFSVGYEKKILEQFNFGSNIYFSIGEISSTSLSIYTAFHL